MRTILRYFIHYYQPQTLVEAKEVPFLSSSFLEDMETPLPKEPQRVCHPLMATWVKKQCANAPGNDSKVDSHIVLKVEYGDKVMELNLVNASMETYTLCALRSKVIDLIFCSLVFVM